MLSGTGVDVADVGLAVEGLARAGAARARIRDTSARLQRSISETMTSAHQDRQHKTKHADVERNTAMRNYVREG